MKDVLNTIDQKLTAELDGIRLRTFADVVNISGDGRDLTREDVERLRAVLAEAGLEEVKSWIATEGASWLSNGIQSVSIRVKAKDQASAEAEREDFDPDQLIGPDDILPGLAHTS